MHTGYFAQVCQFPTTLMFMVLVVVGQFWGEVSAENAWSEPAAN